MGRLERCWWGFGRSRGRASGCLGLVWMKGNWYSVVIGLMKVASWKWLLENFHGQKYIMTAGTSSEKVIEGEA